MEDRRRCLEDASDRRVSKYVFFGIKESMSSSSSKYAPGVGGEIAPVLAIQVVHDEDEDEKVRRLTNFELSLEGPLIERDILSSTKHTIY